MPYCVLIPDSQRANLCSDAQNAIGDRFFTSKTGTTIYYRFFDKEDGLKSLGKLHLGEIAYVITTQKDQSRKTAWKLHQKKSKVLKCALCVCKQQQEITIHKEADTEAVGGIEL